MIYVDSSVVLATLLEEQRRPSEQFWQAPRVASRLMELEVRVRSTDRPLANHAEQDLDDLLARVQFVEIERDTVALLYQKPPKGVRTLDAIHLATLSYLNSGQQAVPLATYDRRLAAAAESMGFTVITP